MSESDAIRRSGGLTIDSGSGKYLEAPRNSAVFSRSLTIRNLKERHQFIPAGPKADLQLSLWRRVKQLEHPNLLRIFETGRWRLQTGIVSMWSWSMPKKPFTDSSPSRFLTESEVRDMLWTCSR